MRRSMHDRYQFNLLNDQCRICRVWFTHWHLKVQLGRPHYSRCVSCGAKSFEQTRARSALTQGRTE